MKSAGRARSEGVELDDFSPGPRDERAVMRAVPGLVELELLVESLLPEQLGEDRDPPAQERLALLVGDVGPGQRVVLRMVVVQGQADLLEVVHALRSSRRLARGLHG